MSDIGFLILHYGDATVTNRCIDSILELDGAESVQIVVADNDPELYNAITIGKECANSNKWSQYNGNIHLHVIPTGSVGFSAANNIAYRWIRKHLNIDILIACNNDIVFVQKDIIVQLERYLASQQERAYWQSEDGNCGVPYQSIAVIGPDVIDYNSGRHQNPLDTRLRTRNEACRTYMLNRIGLALFPVLYRLLDRKLLKMEQNVGHEYQYPGEMENVVLVGACLIFTDAFIKNEWELFSPETQFYYEEYLLFRRCKRKQYRTCYVPGLQVLHHSGTATNSVHMDRREQVRKRMQRTVAACRIYIDSE